MAQSIPSVPIPQNENHTYLFKAYVIKKLFKEISIAIYIEILSSEIMTKERYLPHLE